MNSENKPIPENGKNSEQTEVTIRITQAEGNAAARRVEELQTVVLNADRDDEENVGETSLLRITSTQMLNYISGRKKDHVNDIIDEKEQKRKFSEDPVDFSGDDKSLQPVEKSYEFGGYLAEGGQGVLHTAKDRSLHRRVAVKSLKKELLENHTIRNAFLTEARVTASLDHPAIVPVYGLHTDENNGLHLSMKLLHGKSLKVYFSQVLRCYRERGVLNFDEEAALLYRLDIFLRICDAMSYAHSKGVIHCDLKPENIILGEYRDVYIMDWGIARKLDENGQSLPQKQIMGTPRYTSPENLLNRPCDVRSDVYTLGVILFELVTLRAAFSSRTVQGMVNAVKAHAFVPLRHRFSYHISKDLASIIRKATAFDPNQRYQTVFDLAEDLRRYLRGAEVSSNPDGLFGKAVRWSLKHRKLFFSLLISAILLGLGGAAISVFLNIARTAIEERERDAIKNSVYAAAFQISNRVDRQFTHISYLLSLLNSDIALLLSLPQTAQQSGETFVPVTQFPAHRKNCSGGLKVPYRAVLQDFEHGIVYPPRGGKIDEKSRRKLTPLLGRLQTTFSRELFSGMGGKLSAKAKKDFAAGNIQIRDAYFTLHNGTSFFYPGTDDLPSDYDGRSRPWYVSALNRKGRCIWSDPYADAGEQQQMTVTCSAEIISSQGFSYGVSALDVPLRAIARLMKGSRNNLRFAVERQLLDSNGGIVLAWRRSGKDSLETQTPAKDGVLPKFRDPALFRMMSRMRYGTLIKKEQHGTSLYVFCSIPSVRYLYVERHDFTRLLQESIASAAARKHKEFLQSKKKSSDEKLEGK